MSERGGISPSLVKEGVGDGNSWKNQIEKAASAFSEKENLNDNE